MKQISITTVNGIVNYTLANGAPLPSIKEGNLIFHAKASGLQSIPLAQLVEYEVESVSAGTKSDRIKDQLAGALDHLSALATTVHDEANNSTIAEDAAFAGALLAYAEAFKAFDVQKEKAEKFFERRTATLAKREAEGKTKRSRKTVAAPAPSPTAFASDEPISNAAAPVLPPETAATPKPASKKTAKK